MRTVGAYLIVIVTTLIVVQSTEQIWNLAYPVCEKLQKYLVDDECTLKQQYSHVLIAPDHELDQVLKSKYKKRDVDLPAQQKPINLNNDDTEEESFIKQFWQGLHAQDACEKRDDLGAQFKNYGCSVSKSANELMKTAELWANKVGVTAKEAYKGLNVAFLQDECQNDDTAEMAQDVDIKSSFKKVGCKLKQSANEFKEVAQPWAEKVVFTTKEASAGLFDAFTQTNCEDLTKSGDAAIKSWFQNAGCKFRRGAEDFGQTAAEKIAATATHVNNIVIEKYQNYKAKNTKKSWTDKAADSLRNMGDIVANKYSVLKQAVGFEDAVKDPTWLEKLTTAAKESGNILQQKLEELKKNVNL